jgi:DNA-binding SARP family transcriptional activator
METAIQFPRNLLPPVTERPGEILVCLLGSFRFTHHGQPLKLLIAGKAMTLLSELALHLDEGVTREELLETLWPEQDSAHSTVSLNSLIYSLQRRLKDVVQDSVPLVYENGCYALNKEAGVSTDIARFDTYVNQGTRLAASGNEVTAVRSYKCAADLYRGDLCAGSNVFAIIERERLRARFLSVLAWLADRAYRERDDETALEYALRLLACDPCREDAHRMVMRIRLHRGERSEALRHYRVCEQVLRREFDAVPEAPTRELFDQIRAGSAQR